MKYLLFFIPFFVFSQHVITEYLHNDHTKSHYTIFSPAQEIKAYLLHLGRGKIDNETRSFHQQMASKGILSVAIGKLPTPSILFLEDDYINDINLILDRIHQKYKLKNVPFVIGGMSRFGNAAIYFTEMANKRKSKYIPDAIFAIDPPVDLKGLWQDANPRKLKQLAESTRRENKTINKLFMKRFGGTPDEFPEKYNAQSPYYRDDERGGNIIYIKQTPILLFAEPEINWWLENKSSDLYDSNILKISSMVNDLRSLGNKNVVLYLSKDKGYRSNGKKHPHSWSILNEDYLTNWILQLNTLVSSH